MSRTARIMGVTAAIETSYGVDATPDPLTNAILAKGLSPSPYQGDMVSRDLIKPHLGGEETINAAPYSTVSFDVEIAGSGDPATAPAFGPLLRACGMSETITTDAESENVAYTPVSDSFESATLYVYRAGELHKMIGCRGTVSLNTSAKGIPMMSFTFTGLYSPPESVVMPTFDWSGFQVPLPITKANTPTLDVIGYSAVASEMSIDMGISIAPRNLIGLEEVALTDRDVSGSFTLEAPEIATKNFFADVESHNGVTTGAVQLIHGTTAGNIVQIDAPKVQLSSISHSEADGALMYQMDAKYIPTDAGDDEVSLTFK